MKIVIQRVSKAKVLINEKVYSSIDKGLLILIGIEKIDSINNLDYLSLIHI